MHINYYMRKTFFIFSFIITSFLGFSTINAYEPLQWQDYEFTDEDREHFFDMEDRW